MTAAIDEPAGAPEARGGPREAVDRRRRRSCWPARARRRRSSPVPPFSPRPRRRRGRLGGAGRGRRCPARSAGRARSTRRALADPWRRLVRDALAGPDALRPGGARAPTRARCATGSPRSAPASTPACASAGGSPSAATRSTTRICNARRRHGIASELDGVGESDRDGRTTDPSADGRGARRPSSTSGERRAIGRRRTPQTACACLDAQLDEAVARAVELSLRSRRRDRGRRRWAATSTARGRDGVAAAGLEEVERRPAPGWATATGTA